jgi:hypothetical protein
VKLDNFARIPKLQILDWAENPFTRDLAVLMEAFYNFSLGYFNGLVGRNGVVGGNPLTVKKSWHDLERFHRVDNNIDALEDIALGNCESTVELCLTVSP